MARLELPRELAEWASPLSIFEDDVVAQIGPWLPRMKAMIGPSAVPRSAEHGAIDGFDGLARRGAYERLVVGEWAVAQVEPLEFDRRAAMGEHLFLRPAYREPHGSRMTVAVFDVGPWQLGAPRLVQMAALVVFAQRALDAHATFEFGLLQHPPRRFEVDRLGLGEWLRGRTMTPASFEDLARWREHVDALSDTPLDDLWFIGPSSLRSFALGAKANHLALVDADDRVAVDLLRRDGRVAKAELPLPQPSRAVDMLRAPLSLVRTPRPEVARPRQCPAPQWVSPSLLQLSVDGRRLLVRDEKQRFVAVHVPDSPLETRGNPIDFGVPADWEVRAAGLYRAKRLVVLARPAPGHPLAWFDSRRGWDDPSLTCDDTFDLVTESGDPLPLHVIDSGMSQIAIVVDASGRLHAISRQGWQTRPTIETVDGVEWVVRVAADRVMFNVGRKQVSLGSRSTVELGMPVDAEGLASVLWVGPGYRSGEWKQPSSATDDEYGYLAVTPAGYHLVIGQRPQPFPVSPRFVPHAVLPGGRVLALDAEQREVSVVTIARPDDPRSLLRCDGPIVSLRTQPTCDKLVFVTSEGEYGVFSLRAGLLMTTGKTDPSALERLREDRRRT